MQVLEDPERWITTYACGQAWDVGRVQAVEEPCEFHRQQAIDSKLKKCVKCKTSLLKYLKPVKKCWRCGSRFNLEEDHIVPRSKGGGESRDNKRWMCSGCHDYRHGRDAILKEVERRFSEIEAGRGNQAQLTMWVFRLGITEWFNTPEQVRQRGYKSYGAIAETHYSRWAEAIKAQRWRNPYKALIVDNIRQAKLG